METLLVIKAVILGILEGLTEFLPVSSTGHLIIAEDLLNFNDARAKVFAIAIQLGAVIAVVSIYRQRITDVITGLGRDPLANRLAINVIAAFLPAMVLGLAFHKQIKTLLFNPITVATMLIVGGFVILWAERREHSARMHTLDEIGPLDALKVGFCQALAMIPGTSRSGATIIGGMFCGLSRETATQFSFFLAMPTMLAATVYDLYKSRADLAFDDLGLIAIGFVSAFLAALATVRFMLGFVSKHAFTPFAWYRIVFGLVVLASWYFGWVNWSEPALA